MNETDALEACGARCEGERDAKKLSPIAARHEKGIHRSVMEATGQDVEATHSSAPFWDILPEVSSARVPDSMPKVTWLMQTLSSPSSKSKTWSRMW